MAEIGPEYIITDSDKEKLVSLLKCITDMIPRMKPETPAKLFDNKALNNFIIELTFMLSSIQEKGNIEEWIDSEGNLTLSTKVLPIT